MLGPDLALGPGGCVQFEGGNVDSGLWLWMKRWGTAVALPVPALFGREGAAWLIEDVVFTIGGYRLCLLALDPPARRSLRARLDALGTCWADDLPRILVTGRVAFPGGHRYKLLSTAGARACAVAEDGQITCCGQAGPEPPVGIWKDLAVCFTP
jgi:hypothetical protein